MKTSPFYLPPMTFALIVRCADWKHDESAIAAVRRQVFIEEQGVPEALEWERIDPECNWFVASTSAMDVVGIVRLTAAGRIGRMAVLPEWRRQGVGRALLNMALRAAQQRGLAQVHLSAQTHAMPFYLSHGFVAEGEEYLDAGIPHRSMYLNIQGVHMNIRIGHGFDVHAFAAGRKLIIGGVDIPHPRGLLGHSDADVLLHAICDALLGAAGLGDIGKHFPDSDPAYKGIDSRKLLRHVGALLNQHGWKVGNVDATLIAQAPRMAPHIPAMRARIAEDLDIAVEQVNIKATTTERLGFTGREEGIAAEAVCLILAASRTLVVDSETRPQ